MGLSKEEAKAKVEGLGDDAKVVIRTVEEDATHIDSVAKIKYEENIGAEISKTWSRVDDDIYSVTGKRKTSEQKTYDFNKQSLTELKTIADKVPGLEEKITAFEKGNPNETELVTQLRGELLEVKEGAKQAKETLEGDLLKEKQLSKRQSGKSILSRGLTGIKWQTTIPEGIRNREIEAGQEKLLDSMEEIEGIWVFKDKDGKVRRGTDGVTPLTAEDIQKEMFNEMILEGKTIEGSGHKAGKVDFEKMEMPSGIKNMVQLGDHLVEKMGLVRGSDEYTKAFNKLAPKLDKVF